MTGAEGSAGLVTRAPATLADAFVVAGLGLGAQVGAATLRMLATGPPFRLPDPPLWLSGVCGWGIPTLFAPGRWRLARSG